MTKHRRRYPSTPAQPASAGSSASGADEGNGTSASAAAGSVPSVSALKAEWVAYAESIGIDTTGMTKAQVMDAVEEAE